MIRSPILEHCDPMEWKNHHFGLSIDRWAMLEGRVIIVTGGGSGFGRALAISLACAGCRVWVVGRRIQRLQETKGLAIEFGAKPDRITTVSMDINNLKQIENLVEQLDRYRYPIYGLINNAGVSTLQGEPLPLLTSKIEHWNALMGVNVRAPWLLTRSCIPQMAKHNIGRIVFITSEAAWADTAGMGDYNLSKCALNSLSHNFAREVESAYPNADIQINTVIPGEARTEMNNESAHSPFTIVSLVTSLLSHAINGPNGHFFHRDGQHFSFAYTKPWHTSLL